MLAIVGDGPGRTDLERLATRLNLGNRVRFTGFVRGERLVELLQASDIFVTASKSENMPLAILEAMAVSLPIVAVSSLGLTEIVEHGKNGYLLPPADVQGIAAHVLRLLADDDARHSFSACSLELSEKYSVPSVAARLETLYTRLLATRSP